MNDKEYSALPGLRRSDLWYMDRTPLHFRYHIDNPEEPGPALVFGQAVHKYVLEPETFLDEFTIAPDVDRRTKAGKQAYNEFLNENAGKQVLTMEEFATIGEMKAALISDPFIADIIEGGAHEVAVIWTDPETGVQLKVKADIVDTANRIIYDYKTVRSCADGAFERDSRAYGYKFQAGFYVTGFEQEELERYAFAFIGQEKTPPYAVRLYPCDRGYIAEGMGKFRSLLNRYKTCEDSGEWPGYEEEILYAESY